MKTQKSKSLGHLIDHSPFKKTHKKIWLLSAAGILLDGFDLFVIGLSLPLISKYFKTSPVLTGLIGSSALLGAIFGAIILGYLTDKYGRKTFYMINMVFLIFFGVLSGIAWNPWLLIVSRFFVGMGVGADYPICSSYVSEFMPKKIRGRMLTSSFALQAVGMILAAISSILILKIFPSINAWRYFLLIGVIPAGIILFFRSSVPESIRWLLFHKKYKKAEKICLSIYSHEEKFIKDYFKNEKYKTEFLPERKIRIKELFKKSIRKRTILATVPWFLMDISTYGIGLFTPIILTQLHFNIEHMNFVQEVKKAIVESSFLDLFLIIGFIVNLCFVERVGRMPLQKIGFMGMALGLLILAIPNSFHLSEPWTFGFTFLGFSIFNFMMNSGPNPTTFTLSGELFPTNLRATGSGFAAGIAKLGATLGIFFLPILSKSAGMSITLIILAITSFLGFVFTRAFQIETKGKPLYEG
ncbi:MFS transporter [Aureibacter tunicatorum]|uniref:MFS family permease n=1 Tax=Aureibacter tunicatorum TaxID=866807 RepID=A0AAE3XNU4_9BACT|nr:MFS transporter [Aureibacter tunicatorum]MDR6239887.1 MFS family permease [Aureibacter tunicatorum]BDD04362.1 MFS transporter [Aureibacter tunicatorum]